MSDLKPCPFCGTQPKLPDGDGTQYEIWCEGCCGAVASVQICDLMTLEERAADSFKDYRYGEEFVERAKLEAIAKWNTRAAPAEDVRAVGDEPVVITAVAVTREDEDEGLRLEWLLEGGISELEFAGTVLFAMPEANDLCDEDGSAELYRHPQRPIVLPERSAADYAIEHAGYLAAAADSVQEAYKAYSLAQMNVDEGGDDGEGELDELVDDARNDLHEALHDLRGMAYEFRKRRDRATPQ